MNTKSLVFKERLIRKLTEQYIGLYMIEKVMSANVVKLKLLALIRIHLVVNVSRIVRYREPVKRQRMKELKLVTVNRKKEWEVEKILNKRIV